MRPHLLRLVLALSIVAASARCAGSDDVADEPGGDDVAIDEPAVLDGGDDADEPVAADLDTDSDMDLARGDIDCTPDGLGEDDSVDLVLARYVVDGDLGADCFGEPDDVLLDAWDDLAAITPPDQLNDLAAFAGFASTEGGDEETLAYVTPLDGEGETFLMAINLDAYEDDRDQALLTVAHEFSHVFTLLPSQVDRSNEAFDSCETYLSSEGCFLDDSLIAAWVDEFWSDAQLDSLDPEADPSGAEGEARCAADPGFLGPYAASDPEEDFAESFSAYVFDVEAASDGQQDRLDWLAEQPGLVAFRDRAVDAGLTPLANEFETCG